jgi:hypothetical protein
VVGYWTDAADARRYYGQVFGSSAFAEFFKAAEFWNLEVSLVHVAFIV